MLEVCVAYDLLPGVNQDSYGAWAKKAISTTFAQPGLVEFRAHRNIMGSPEVRTTSVWRSGADWIAFAEGWQRTSAWKSGVRHQWFLSLCALSKR